MARTVLAAVVAVISMLASGSGYASATTAPDEAQLLNSSPENGQTIPDSPTQIVIGFTTELNDSGNTISLECETQTIPLPPVEVIEDAKSLSVEVPQAVPKGTCLVKWAIAATEDVEATEGSI